MVSESSLRRLGSMSSPTSLFVAVAATERGKAGFWVGGEAETDNGGVDGA